MRNSILIMCLIFVNCTAFSQQKETSVQLSCYVNEELYLNAGIIGFTSDKAGNTSCKGEYINFFNGSKSSFFYEKPDSLIQNPSAENWVEIKPSQQAIIPVAVLRTDYESGAKVAVPLKVRYTLYPGNNSLRNNALEKMNLNSKKIEAREFPKSADTAVSFSRKTAPSQTCFSVTDPAYYTFYYLQVGTVIYYTEPFSIPDYKNEEEAKDVLSKALACFKNKLQLQGEETKLNSNKIGLETGFQALRNTNLLPSEIESLYPWVVSKAAAKAELEKWILYDRNKGTISAFTKIDFSG
ncbi:hypothetical protein [Rubrolithibacter danxiaensis]|uniref:hypothetical protein n=1 Tax=Rubrolithibacter danxiaensis TaxID=3390805 RepID=UPI003BF89B7C